MVALLVRGQSRRRTWFDARLIWLPILRRRNFTPLARLGLHLNAIADGQTIHETLFAIAAPDDAINLHHARQFDLHPTLAALVGNPAPTVAVFAVVDVMDLMNGGVGE